MERQDGVRAPILVIVPAEYRVAGAPPASWYIDVKKRTLARTPVMPVKTVTGSLRVSTPEATALELLRDVAAAGYLSNVAPVLHELAEACDAGRLVEAAQTGPGGGAVRGSGARAHCVASPGGSTLTRGDKAMFDRITFDSRVMGGRACIRGLRIPVSLIVGQIAHGATFDEILAGYPDLEREDIQQAMEYAAWLTRDEVRVP